MPFKSIRKVQKKLIADEYAEIAEFYKKGEFKKVKWRMFWLKIHWVRYLISHPISALLKLTKKYISN